MKRLAAASEHVYNLMSMKNSPGGARRLHLPHRSRVRTQSHGQMTGTEEYGRDYYRLSIWQSTPCLTLGVDC